MNFFSNSILETRIPLPSCDMEKVRTRYKQENERVFKMMAGVSVYAGVFFSSLSQMQNMRKTLNSRTAATMCIAPVAYWSGRMFYQTARDFVDPSIKNDPLDFQLDVIEIGQRALFKNQFKFIS